MGKLLQILFYNESLSNKSVTHKFLHETFKNILIVYKRILLDLDRKLEDKWCLISLQSQ